VLGAATRDDKLSVEFLSGTGKNFIISASCSISTHAEEHEAMSTTTETFAFQAETTQLLELMIHSLYTHKDIFLRELISNASDALDRLRFEALTRPDLLADNDTLEIRLEADKTARTLTIHDTGIGMNRDEIMSNIGTIAKSGTRALLEQIKTEGKSDEMLGELIGRFGVGFFSDFMVADQV
jgi:molecular chaperone HtpG